MLALGIDCGLAITGWSIVRKKGNSFSVLGYGVIRTKAGESLPKRIKKLYDEITDKLVEYKPETVAIESLFYFKNQKTVMSVGQARGVVVLSAAEKGLEVYDYTPLQVKQAVTGYGKAAKDQVQQMVKRMLGLKKLPKPDDAADALAVAVCHLNSVQSKYK